MIWYPYTQMKTMNNPYKIIKAEGEYLYTQNNKMIDSISSWWSAIHGYNNPQLNQAIKNQTEKFAHVMLGGLTHEPVENLSKRLETLLPGDLNYSFFSDSGSVAVEVALKMALQYYVNRNEYNRTMVMSLKNAYHGDTFKAMEVGDDEDYHFISNALGKNKNIIHIPTNINDLEQAFSIYHKQLNCFIVEPLLQAAGGMKIYNIEFLKRARELCTQYDVLLIFDEVATGFGRTGNRFVSDLVMPDILVLGKALTAGYIGHAVTIATQKVYNGFYSNNKKHAFMHGPTFMGNALACSVALASIDLFENSNYMSKIHTIEKITREQMKNFHDDRIKDIRIIGACICIEVYDANTIKGYQQFAYERGVFSRPFLNYLYAMVPYIISKENLIHVLETMKEWFKKN